MSAPGPSIDLAVSYRSRWNRRLQSPPSMCDALQNSCMINVWVSEHRGRCHVDMYLAGQLECQVTHLALNLPLWVYLREDARGWTVNVSIGLVLATKRKLRGSYRIGCGRAFCGFASSKSSRDFCRPNLVLSSCAVLESEAPVSPSPMPRGMQLSMSSRLRSGSDILRSHLLNLRASTEV